MMKFKSIVFLASIILSVEYTFSQEDSVVLDTQYNQEEEMVEVIEKQTVFPGFYLGWSYLKPIGNYSRNKTAMLKPDSYNQNEIVKNIAGKSLGLAFELGYFYWLEDIKFPLEEMRLGVKTVYLSPQFIFINNYDLDNFDFNNSFKVGPTFAYNALGSLVLDASLTAGPTLFYSGNWQHLSLLFNYGLEVAVRYKPVYLGLGITFGKYTMRTSELVDQFDMPISRMNITFGFNF